MSENSFWVVYVALKTTQSHKKKADIEEYLLKLNLLDRKSDSGEAQYVTVIL